MTARVTDRRWRALVDGADARSRIFDRPIESGVAHQIKPQNKGAKVDADLGENAIVACKIDNQPEMHPRAFVQSCSCADASRLPNLRVLTQETQQDAGYGRRARAAHNLSFRQLEHR